MAVQLNTNINMQSGDFMPSDAADYFKEKMKKNMIISVIIGIITLCVFGMFINTAYNIIISKDPNGFGLSVDGNRVSIAELLQTEGVIEELWDLVYNELGPIFIIMMLIIVIMFIYFIFSTIKSVIVSIGKLIALDNNDFEYRIAEVTDKRIIRRNKNTKRILELDDEHCKPLSYIDFLNADLGIKCYMCKINSLGAGKIKYAFPVDFKNMPQTVRESYNIESAKIKERQSNPDFEYKSIGLGGLSIQSKDKDE